jgi:hypothetical protein
MSQDPNASLSRSLAKAWASLAFNTAAVPKVGGKLGPACRFLEPDVKLTNASTTTNPTAQTAAATVRCSGFMFVKPTYAYTGAGLQSNNSAFELRQGEAMYSNELVDEVSMVSKASHMRELAQDRIVRAFRSQIDGQGAGPSDEDLQSFARLALVEDALRRSCLVRPPKPALAPDAWNQAVEGPS